MSNVAIVTDSTACIPTDLTKDLPVYTVPPAHQLGRQKLSG